MISKRKYLVVMIDRQTGNVTKETLSLEELLDQKQEYEYIYSLQENIDSYLDMPVGKASHFQPNRDNDLEIGLILRLA